MACVGPCAPALSFADLESLWTNAGGNAIVAPIMAAIALAESSGIANNLNPNDSNGAGGTQASSGLWQVSNGTTTPITNWSDPAANAVAAVAKYNNAGGFSPWGTFTSGAYVPFLQTAIADGQTTAAAASTALGSGSALASSTAAPSSSTTAGTFAPSALTGNTATLVIVFAALVLLLGIWAMTRSSPAPKAAAA